MSEAMRRYSQAQAQMRALEVGELEQARTLDAADGRDMAAYYADLERQERMMGG